MMRTDAPIPETMKRRLSAIARIDVLLNVFFILFVNAFVISFGNTFVIRDKKSRAIGYYAFAATW